MAEVTLLIGGHSYQMACRTGEEAHLLKLGDIVDSRVQEAQQTVGATNEVRSLLFASLLFADEALEAKPAAQSAPAPDLSPALINLAQRLELLADRLENSVSSA
jgi:cell division protein ZapA